MKLSWDEARYLLSWQKKLLKIHNFLEVDEAECFPNLEDFIDDVQKTLDKMTTAHGKVVIEVKLEEN